MRDITKEGQAVAKLKSQVDAINRKVDDIVKKTMTAHSGPCRAIAAQVMIRLPRELRHELYSYLYPKHIVEAFELEYSSGLLKTLDLERVSAYVPDRPRDSPYTIMSAWLGPGFAKELIEHWYNHQVIHVRPRRQLRPAHQKRLGYAPCTQ